MFKKQSYLGTYSEHSIRQFNNLILLEQAVEILFFQNLKWSYVIVLIEPIGYELERLLFWNSALADYYSTIIINQ